MVPLHDGVAQKFLHGGQSTSGGAFSPFGGHPKRRSGPLLGQRFPRLHQSVGQGAPEVGAKFASSPDAFHVEGREGDRTHFSAV